MEEEAEDQLCSRCGMPALVLHNGLLVCEACGTQAEVPTLPLSLLAAKKFHQFCAETFQHFRHRALWRKQQNFRLVLMTPRGEGS